ncbi:MAG: DNRLRE domain-containing protein, partial [Planctomycetes bacterium]|nr:DNRLRE domain-containing protein [Planctomycetota bacterium]
MAAGLALLTSLSVLQSGAAAQDFGHEGPSFSGAGAAPTESKPESKLWFHDGAWWGSLWSTSGQAFHIHRLDQSTHVWTDTGVPIDFRSHSKSDALFDGTKLYVASHRFSSDGGASGNSILMLRYGYDSVAKSYALDPGFPVTIGSFSTESMVIDKDSTGTVWAAWVQGLRVYTSHSVGGDDLIWTTPAILPGSDSDLTLDEVCSLIHFGGDRIGVLWSDQALNLFRFAIHQDGAPDDVWSLETPLSGESDDHIHLATDAAGRVFATVKNAADELKLLVRDAGNWTSFLVSTGADRLTRPIVLLDEERRRIHVFASGQDNGLIHEKTASLDAIAFASGPGTVVIQDASDPLVNNATSTKQNVDSSTGLVVLAAHETTESYWHHTVAPAALLVASFSAAPLAGQSPLDVQFTDTSTGAPTSWSWDFGDGGTAVAQNPLHEYIATGIFPVSLTVGTAGGSDEETWSNLITVTPALPTQSFPVLADARVNEASPASNSGTAPALQVRFAAGGSFASYLRFDLSGLSGPVVSAKLRLFCTDGSTVGGLVFPTTNAWSETAINWNNRPAATGGLITQLGSITASTWVEFDVTSAVGAPGLVSFLLTSTTSNSAVFSSREGAQPPELVVELFPPTVADFSANPTAGAAPLSVAFTDLSSGSPTSWSWDFGDGTLELVPSPVHVYANPGSFSVTLSASGPGGADGETQTNLVTVTLPLEVSE